MAKITYVEKNFSAKNLNIIRQANQIIAEYQAEGFDLTLRQLYYQFVSRGFFLNDTKMYKRFGSVIGDARLAGFIDWEVIEDRARNVQSLTHWKDPGQILKAAHRSFCLDHWKGQEYRVEVWIEKEALVGVIASICDELDVPYFACKGYVSLSEMWAASQRFIEHQEEGQIPVIVHLGDHDPSGIDMTRDIFDRQDLFMEHAGPEVKRIALNMNQIEEFSPPPNPAKLTDSRCGGYVAKYGSESWELDALEPRVLRNLIANTVGNYRDEDVYAEVIAQEIEYKEVLNRVEKNWKTL